MSKPEKLLVLHKFSELKIYANNAKIRSSLKFLLIWYLDKVKAFNCCFQILASSYLSVDSYRLYKEKTIIISLVSIFSISLIIMGSFLLYRVCLSSRKHAPSPLDAVEAPPFPRFQSEDLKIMSLICKTKNGEVWRGQLGEIPVAVKVFLQSHKHLYQNEKYIYSLPFIEHENLLKFYGVDERQNTEGFWQYMIVLSYVPKGSLFGYLQHNTIDWNTFCNMCLSTVKGVVHLHTDQRNVGKKYSISLNKFYFDFCCVRGRDLHGMSVIAS